MQAITINTNGWTDAGHAVNQVYDILYMMGRNDVAVGVGGEGGIRSNGTIMPDVGGYLPIIDQEDGTAGYCRYRQAVPIGRGGRLDIDSNYGFRKSFLPQALMLLHAYRGQDLNSGREKNGNTLTIEGTTSQIVDSNAIKTMRVTLKAMTRILERLNTEVGAVKKDLTTIKRDVSTINGRLEKLESQRNSRPSTPQHISSNGHDRTSSATVTPETWHQMLNPP
ncbi:hypothetical protein FXO37_31122 [Capsicum annuum]|nr:hypothetical protein FXO37_31122 [Capsicum annuum]